MITFPKVKAASWAMGKRLQGYHLLKNPKGTSQTEINVIKEEFYETTECSDNIFYINRIKKVYHEKGSENESKWLMSVHFFDTKKMQMTKPRKKNIVFSVRRNGKLVNISERDDLAWEPVSKRTAQKLSKKKNRFI